ncbi:phospholipase effector Tle1 domain-containing protein [Chryseobacterium bernardetii]|uniref:phospholipase effector Tle1 domain-containing protein n=1 Tax=Chryseobacterium bernardetii TaxID=1241978 RepID=UPI003018DC80
MGKTFVYNTGNNTPPIDELHLEIGVFFDGTLNNLKNTELRQKYKDGKNKIESTDSDEVVAKKEEAIEATTKQQEKEYDNLDHKKNPDAGSEYDQYLKAIHRSRLDKMGVDNSFSNDFTNVARLYKCCEQNTYAIYIEGIGTLDNRRDVDDGFQYGSGITGVRGKVRKGCEKLADRIKVIIRNSLNADKQFTKIYIDTFGFSRGAAAARNFAYEINGKKRAKDVEIRKSRKVVGYTQFNSPEGPVMVPEYGDIWLDKDDTEVDPQYIIDGKLPKFGFLGYYLLSKDILTKEELEDLELDVRFIGVYDTVSSYEEYGDMGGMRRVGWEGMKHSVLGPKYNFGDDVEQLQLLNPGSYFKAVHFTAENEHRENFSLTRFPGSIEKEFPGVHCDIGGAYESGKETVDEIETSNHKPVWFLNKRRQQLIDEHWFNKDQIEINNSFLNVLTMGAVYRKITGIRFLRKEYSYIPLQFMEELGKNLYDHQLNIKTETTYSIEHDNYLNQTKDILHHYVFDGGEKWNFKPDEVVEKERQERARARLENPEPVQEPIPDEVVDKDGNIIKTKTLQEVVVTAYHPQTLLRIIRNKYLHWSANRDWMGMDPNNDYQRRIYP